MPSHVLPPIENGAAEAPAESFELGGVDGLGGDSSGSDLGRQNRTLDCVVDGVVDMGPPEPPDDAASQSDEDGEQVALTVAVPIVPTPSEAAESAVIGVLGYVYSRVAPWCLYRDTIGRIKRWKDEKSMFGTEHYTVTCFQHPGCQPPPISCAWVPDQKVLLEWVFSCTPWENDAQRTKEEAQKHMAAFKELRASLRPSAPR